MLLTPIIARNHQRAGQALRDHRAAHRAARPLRSRRPQYARRGPEQRRTRGCPEGGREGPFTMRVPRRRRRWLERPSPSAVKVSSFQRRPRAESTVPGTFSVCLFCVHANPAPNIPMEQSENDLLWRPLDPNDDAGHYSGKTVVVGHTPQTDGRMPGQSHVNSQKNRPKSPPKPPFPSQHAIVSHECCLLR